MSAPYSVLFICLGNICRSPLAQGVFEHLVSEQGLEADFTSDSCGTGAWHVGEQPHRQSQRVAKQNGIDLSAQRARQLRRDDLSRFSLLVAMDQENRSDVISVCGESDKIVLMRDYDPKPDDGNVPDPYYGGDDGFDKVFDILYRSNKALLDSLVD